MQHIFLPPEQIENGQARIVGSDHLHLARVLRACVGDVVVVLNNQGNGYRARLVSIGKNETLADIEAAINLPPEPLVSITVAQAVGKGDKFEQVIQHGTECGASTFVPLLADRCVVELPAAKIPDRMARWQQIAKSAAEQSHRARIPDVQPPVKFARLMADAKAANTSFLMLHTADAVTLRETLAQGDKLTRLIVAVGPEGGWSEAEVFQARAANVPLVSLGPRVLRTETAALVAVSQILYSYP